MLRSCNGYRDEYLEVIILLATDIDFDEQLTIENRHSPRGSGISFLALTDQQHLDRLQFL